MRSRYYQAPLRPLCGSSTSLTALTLRPNWWPSASSNLHSKANETLCGSANVLSKAIVPSQTSHLRQREAEVAALAYLFSEHASVVATSVPPELTTSWR